MKNRYTQILKCTHVLPALFLFLAQGSIAQTCSTTQGDQNTYGANNTWIGYVYQGKNFDTYFGYVNEGNSTNPNFDESFGGSAVNYNTNGCAVYTENFSVRYKLAQTFASSNYSITVGGDDGYRLSLDGGATWVINKWNDQGYGTTTATVALNGNTNMILEYYENGGDNRISFNIIPICTGTGDPSIYGTGNIWIGYMYQGMNFDQYKGWVTEGISGGSDFNENFGNPGGGNVTYNTNSCSIQTQQFSARYRLQTTLAPAHYVITVGGDDGFRLSLDGGATWVINRWNDQSYTIASYNAFLSGPQSMVLEYFQDGGADQVSFSMTSTILPVTLIDWSVSAVSNEPDQALLKWQANHAINFDHYTIQRSTDGTTFNDVYTVPAAAATGATTREYSYTDHFAYSGTVYYRLLMADLDGTINYSTILTLSLQSTKSARIYPTVVEDGNLFVESSSSSVRQARLEIFDMNGRRVRVNDWSVLNGRQQVSVNGNNGKLPAGAYIARLADNSTVLVRQLILIK